MSPLASTSIFIDKYHPQKDGKCAVSIKVTFQRKKKYFKTEYSLTPDDFNRVIADRPRNEFKEISLKLNHLENRAAEIIRGMSVFTWESFAKQYQVNKSSLKKIEYAFGEVVKQLKQENRYGTAVTYECAKNSIAEFAPTAVFADVTPTFLNKYEKWMLNAGKSVTTIGIYLRSLRTLFNNAIADQLISKELYPFGKRKYEIPTANNVKKAIPLDEISLIYNYDVVPGSNTERARDYWMFMYFCNGINVKDLCLLKYKNIKGDILSFERAKTVRTKRKVEPIRVSLLDDAKAIIKKWGAEMINDESYIFPVLFKGVDGETQQKHIKLLTHLINDHMKIIADTVGITGSLTTYSARHSFATVLKRSGASTEFIGEALGHSNVKTTQNYLAGFEDEHKKEIAKALTAFKNKVD